MLIILTDWLTYSMEQSPSWETNRFAAGQEIPRIFFRFHNQQSEYLGAVWGPLQRGEFCRGFNQLLIDVWLFVTEVSTLSLILLITQNMVTTGILPPTREIPMVEPGIEPGTSWLVARSSDH